MNLLELLFIIDGSIFLFIMIALVILMKDCAKTEKIEKKPREGFCTCRGMQFNNSEADVKQGDCYRNKIPAAVWDKSHAGCTSFDDPGKIAYDYNILQKQLPDFAGV